MKIDYERAGIALLITLVIGIIMSCVVLFIKECFINPVILVPVIMLVFVYVSVR